MVSREVNDVVVILVDVPADQTVYTDTSPAAGLATYYVSAVDINGNESAYATSTVFVGSNAPPTPFEE